MCFFNVSIVPFHKRPQQFSEKLVICPLSLAVLLYSSPTVLPLTTSLSFPYLIFFFSFNSITFPFSHSFTACHNSPSSYNNCSYIISLASCNFLSPLSPWIPFLVFCFLRTLRFHCFLLSSAVHLLSSVLCPTLLIFLLFLSVFIPFTLFSFL